jgi:hypothetical protein
LIKPWWECLKETPDNFYLVVGVAEHCQLHDEAVDADAKIVDRLTILEF